MNLTHIEHIGIAVKNLDDSIKFYEDILGLKCYAVEVVNNQKVKTAFFQVGETKIELLESTEPDGPIGKFIKNKGEGLHHIAFRTDDINKSLEELKEKNVSMIDNHPRRGSENLNIAFIHPKSANGVLMELCG
jgi:methylmalonyl-CoA/ethylmalonyl-CoA epimerase